ncbi:TniQ family protein [Duganella sp. sic0402]|uniref:TniQ family protein n=1 Tax=Duganella sp. sic0402 TaxID=2854786 RepID=UPI001C43DD86|nr:TniQ family protein [Duganella sp. sic0402]MBV7539214.1 TniQ family protein [Duganella sp. sic0402]
MKKNSRKKIEEALVAQQAAQLEPIEGLVLNWQEDETLYSLLARNHQVRGAMSPEDTIKMFFGSASGGSLHEDHSEIDIFVVRTQGSLGTAEQILEEHTLFRFFRMFMNSNQLKQVESGRRSAKKMLNFPLALPIGGFRNVHPLKGCPACCNEDMATTGMPYWRLRHQYLGVWVCFEHNRPLQLTTQVPTVPRGFHWVTPDSHSFAPIHNHLADPESFEKFKWMGEFVLSLIADFDAGTDRVEFERRRLNSYARDYGLLTPNGRLRSYRTAGVYKLITSFSQFAETYRSCREFDRLPTESELIYPFLSRYLNCQSQLRPSELLVLTAWVVSFFANA